MRGYGILAMIAYALIVFFLWATGGSPWAVPIGYLSMACLLAWLDAREGRKPALPYARVLPCVALNHALHGLFFWAVYLPATGARGVRDVDNPSLARLMAEIALSFLVYELVFYVGHRALHTRALYAFHRAHHETDARMGVSSLYMHPLDLFVEVIVPLWAAPLLLDTSRTATVCYVTVGAMNSVYSHGGHWLPGFSNPLSHWKHHAHFSCNLGVGLLDPVCGTQCSHE